MAKILRRRKRRGATLVLICLLMIVVVGMTALAVDLGRMYLVRSQLQSAVDAGALAATLQLRQDPNDIDAAVAKANEFIQYNRVGWLVTVPDDAITVETGNWDPDTNVFSDVGDVNAVRVSASADDEPLMFAGVFGRETFNVPRSAIASGQSNPQDIMLTLDLSGSMEDYGRIEALQEAAPEFIEVIEDVGDDDYVGVMGYGADIGGYDPVDEGHNGQLYLNAPQDLYPDDSDWIGVLEAELTMDFDYLRDYVLDTSSLVADKYDSYTPTGAAIRDSAHYLIENSRDGAGKVIVLMSDGYANRPSGNGSGYALEMAAYAAQNHITIYTISLGDDADEELMQSIADATGGEHFDAAGTGDDLAEELADAFRKVASAIKRTQLVQ